MHKYTYKEAGNALYDELHIVGIPEKIIEMNDLSAEFAKVSNQDAILSKKDCLRLVNLLYENDHPKNGDEIICHLIGIEPYKGLPLSNYHLIIHHFRNEFEKILLEETDGEPLIKEETMVAFNDKIKAIKMYRKRVECGLLAAKITVERAVLYNTKYAKN